MSIMRTFYNEIYQYKSQVFSIDKLTSKNNEASKVIVRFNNGRTVSKFYKNNNTLKKYYSLLRKNVLNITR